MKFYQIAIQTSHQNVELVADVAFTVTGEGVVIVDKEDFDSISTWDYVEQGLEKQFDQGVFVKCFCNLDELSRVLAELESGVRKVDEAAAKTFALSEIDDEQYKDNWKKYYLPVPVGALTICPVWLDNGEDRNVLIDTGLAFGTGQHETTYMCALLLQGVNLKGKTLLDVGCGSGVLGLCGAKLGAKKITMVDNDEQATETAEKNAALNGMLPVCNIVNGNLTDSVKGRFDCVVANLTAPILALLFNDISKVVKSGTDIILSGILDTYCERITKLYEQKFTLISTEEKGEWRALHLRVE